MQSLTPWPAPGADAPWLFVAEIEHRMANAYASAAASISLAAREAPSEAVRGAFRTASERLIAHAELHRALQAPRSDAPVDLFASLEQLCEAASRADLSGRSPRLALRGESLVIDAGRAWIAGLIVAELVINAAKHGPRVLGGLIDIDLRSVSSQVRCRVTDQGAAPAAARTGAGSGIVEALARMLGGRVTTAFQPTGTTATLSFPETPHA